MIRASNSWMVQNLATLGSFPLSSPAPLLWSLESAYEMERGGGRIYSLRRIASFLCVRQGPDRLLKALRLKEGNSPLMSIRLSPFTLAKNSLSPPQTHTHVIPSQS